MLPLLASGIGGGIAKSIPKEVWKGLFFIGLLAGTYFLLRKIIGSVKTNTARGAYGEDTESGRASEFATLLYNAMISTAEIWNAWFGDGTNEQLMYQTAAQIKKTNTDFGKVIKAYKALYGRDLLEDINQELSSDELAKFNKALKTGLEGLQIRPDMFLKTINPSIIYNKQLQPVNAVKAKTVLGKLNETLLLNKNTMHGFELGGEQRYVPAKNTIVYKSLM